MAVTFKRKPKVDGAQIPLPLKDPASEISEAEKEALEAVGLLPASKMAHPQPSKLRALSVGDQVVVNHGLYPWHKLYRQGDVGVIVGYWAAPATPYTIRPDHDLVAVKFSDDRKVATLQRWELDLLGTQGPSKGD